MLAVPIFYYILLVWNARPDIRITQSYLTLRHISWVDGCGYLWTWGRLWGKKSMNMKLYVALVIALFEHSIVENVCYLWDFTWWVHDRNLLHNTNGSLHWLLLRYHLSLLDLRLLFIVISLIRRSINYFSRYCIQIPYCIQNVFDGRLLCIIARLIIRHQPPKVTIPLRFIYSTWLPLRP